MNSRKLALSILSLTSAKFMLQLVKWAATFVVIRYLAPTDYAVVSLFSLVTTFAAIACGQQLSSSLIQRKELGEHTVGHHMALSLMVGCLIGGSLWLATPLVVTLFDSPDLGKVLPIGCISIVISAVNSVPSNLLHRDLAFNKTALLSLGRGLVDVVCTLLLAINGFGYLSIILGHFIAQVVALPVYILITKYSLKPRWRGMGEIRNDVIFNTYLLGSAFCWFAYARVDVLLGGLALTKTELGIYAVALQLVLMPMNKLMPILRQVSYPVLSRADHRANELFLRMLEMTLLVITPISAGLALTADLWVPLLIGDKWLPIVPVSAVLALLVPFRIIVEVQLPFLKSKGLGREVLQNAMISVVVILLIVIWTQRYGLMGIAWGVTGAFPIAALLTVSRTVRHTQLDLGRVLSAIVRPSLCLLLMCVAVVGFRNFGLGPAPQSGVVDLALAVAVGAIAYTAAASALCLKSIGWFYAKVRA